MGRDETEESSEPFVGPEQDSAKKTEQLAHGDHPELHGDLAFWFFAMAELGTIAIGLMVFALAKKDATQEVLSLHQALHQELGFINTLLLLTSGALVAAAVGRESRDDDAFLLWWGALILGLSFLGVKGFEFFAMAQAGFNLSSGPLVSGYFLLTGFHFLHVGLGAFFIASILWQRWLARKTSIQDEEKWTEAKAFGASAGVFWHSLDLMWIMIFAVVYS